LVVLLDVTKTRNLISKFILQTYSEFYPFSLQSLMCASDSEVGILPS